MKENGIGIENKEPRMTLKIRENLRNLIKSGREECFYNNLIVRRTFC